MKVQASNLLPSKYNIPILNKEIDSFLLEIEPGEIEERCKLSDINRVVSAGLLRPPFSDEYFQSIEPKHQYIQSKLANSGGFDSCQTLVPCNKIIPLLKLYANGDMRNQQLKRRCWELLNPETTDFHQPELFPQNTPNPVKSYNDYDFHDNLMDSTTDWEYVYEFNGSLLVAVTHNRYKSTPIITTRLKSNDLIIVYSCDSDPNEILDYWTGKGVTCEIYTSEETRKFINGEKYKPIDNRRELDSIGF